MSSLTGAGWICLWKTIVGEAAFALAFVAGILYLIKNVNWREVDSRVKIKSFNAMLISLGAGLIVVFGLLNPEDRPVLSAEVRPLLASETSEVVIANTKRVIKEAWALV